MEAALIGPNGRMSLGPAVLTIGRMPGNQLLLTDSLSSAHHAEIRPDGQGYSIIDLGSMNGTFVNEQPLTPNTPRQLSADDRVRIGETIFIYEISGAEPLAPTAYLNRPGKGNEAAFDPTIAAPPPPFTSYAPNQEQGYRQAPPPPLSPQYVPPVPPGYSSSVPPQKKSRRSLWITLSIIVGVLVLGCIALAAFAYANRSTPAKTLTTFCSDLKSGNYHDAYQQLSARAQRTESEDKFTTSLQSSFSQLGGLKDCTFSNESDDGSTTGTALMTWTVNLTLVPAINFNTKLVNENGSWKIDQLARPR